MFIGLILGIFSFVFIGMATFVSKIYLSKVLAFFCFIGLLLPFRFYKKWFSLTGIEAVLFNIMATGPIICSILLWLNFLIRMNTEEEVFNVSSSRIISAENFDHIDVIFTLENDSAYAGYPEFRTMSLDKGNLKKAETKKIKIKTARGLLGYRVFLGNEAIFE